MTTLSNETKVSPRFENTRLCYYEGDTFSLEIPIDLSRDGEKIDITENDIIKFTFYDAYGDFFTEREFTNIENNTVLFDWNEEFTSLFKKGRYTYRIRYNGECVRTISADCMVVVE